MTSENVVILGVLVRLAIAQNGTKLLPAEWITKVMMLLAETKVKVLSAFMYVCPQAMPMRLGRLFVLWCL